VTSPTPPRAACLNSPAREDDVHRQYGRHVTRAVIRRGARSRRSSRQPRREERRQDRTWSTSRPVDGRQATKTATTITNSAPSFPWGGGGGGWQGEDLLVATCSLCQPDDVGQLHLSSSRTDTLENLGGTWRRRSMGGAFLSSRRGPSSHSAGGRRRGPSRKTAVAGRGRLGGQRPHIPDKLADLLKRRRVPTGLTRQDRGGMGKPAAGLMLQ